MNIEKKNQGGSLFYVGSLDKKIVTQITLLESKKSGFFYINDCKLKLLSI